MDQVWIVTKILRIQRDNKNVLLHPVDPIPEAEHWKNAATWERRGYIKKIPIPTLENPVDVKIHHLMKPHPITVRLTEIEGIEAPPIKRKRGRPRKNPIQ